MKGEKMTDETLDLVDLLLHIAEGLDRKSERAERIAGDMAFRMMLVDPTARLNWAVSEDRAWHARIDRLEARALVREARALMAGTGVAA